MQSRGMQTTDIPIYVFNPGGLGNHDQQQNMEGMSQMSSKLQVNWGTQCTATKNKIALHMDIDI